MDKSQMVNELIAHYCNGNKAQFASLLGVRPQTINSWISRETFDTELIYAKCVGISADWLLTGEGDMLKTKRSAASDSTLHEPKIAKKEVISQETRPRIPFDAAAGSLSGALGSVLGNNCERIPLIPTFPRYDFTIVARGESMEPQYMSGDELACLFIKEESFIQWGRAHVLDTAQGIVVKRIYDNGPSITCKSNNPAYPDFDIPKTDIYRIALVVGYLRIE